MLFQSDLSFQALWQMTGGGTSFVLPLTGGAHQSVQPHKIVRQQKEPRFFDARDGCRRQKHVGANTSNCVRPASIARKIQSQPSQYHRKWQSSENAGVQG